MNLQEVRKDKAYQDAPKVVVHYSEDAPQKEKVRQLDLQSVVSTAIAIGVLLV